LANLNKVSGGLEKQVPYIGWCLLTTSEALHHFFTIWWNTI